MMGKLSYLLMQFMPKFDNQNCSIIKNIIIALNN